MSVALRPIRRDVDRAVRPLVVIGATAAGIALLLGLQTLGASPANAPVASFAPAPVDGARIELAPLVAGWPAEYTVTGTKSEPLYVEHITSTRSGDVFALRIDVAAQGDSPLGVQESAVRVGPEGGIEWLSGCVKSASACAADPGLRGFLTRAAVLAAERTGSLPATGAARTLHGVGVVCLEPSALYPESPATTDLEPCLSRSTGALLGHWSGASGAFVGPTFGTGFTEIAVADSALLDPLVL